MGKGYVVYGRHGKKHRVLKYEGIDLAVGTKGEAQHLKNWAENVLRGQKLRKKVKLSIRGY
jgi:hypothetical protein